MVYYSLDMFCPTECSRTAFHKRSSRENTQVAKIVIIQLFQFAFCFRGCPLEIISLFMLPID